MRKGRRSDRDRRNSLWKALAVEESCILRELRMFSAQKVEIGQVLINLTRNFEFYSEDTKPTLEDL
jgi:hypothetical protein